jgi:hypothetical protein
LGTRKLDAEIAATTADIKAKETELMDELRGGKDKDIIEFLRESITALRTKKGKLIDSRDKLQHDIATQPTQGKFIYCRYVVMSLCHYVDRFPNSLSSLCQSVC